MFENNIKRTVGGKAAGLFFLRENDFPVPDFFVIPWQEFEHFDFIKKINDFQQLKDDASIIQFSKKAKGEILDARLPEKFVQEIILKCRAQFGSDFNVSVRSSAYAEDSDLSSFAGQFSSFLYVNENQLHDKILACLASAWSPHVLKYMLLRDNKITKPRMSVILQQMIDARSSGVLFTKDVNGNMNDMIVVAGYGAGEGVVADKVETDTYRIDKLNKKVRQQIVKKNTALVENPSKGGLAEINIEEDLIENPVLKMIQLLELFNMSERLEQLLKKPQDIEFTIDNNGKIFILQTRPITTVDFQQIKIYDNSNISESYPGITLPLSFSYAQNGYRQVFSGAASAFSVPREVVEKNAALFKDLLAHVNGRMYYQLHNWYTMMALIMPSKKSLESWEKNLGVQKGESGQLKISFAKLMKTRFMLVKLLFTHQKNSRKFFRFFHKEYNELRHFDKKNATAKELYNFYLKKGEILFSGWAPTLVNDLIAFKAFDILQKILLNFGFSSALNLANDLLCGIEGVESEEALLNLLQMKELVENDPRWNETFQQKQAAEILKIIKEPGNSILSGLFNNYLDKFGDRTLEELKLESVSLRHQPELLVQMIKNQLGTNNSVANVKSRQKQIRTQAEQMVEEKFSKISLKRFYYNYVLKLARKGIRNRENMRLCRTRAYGAVKDIFLAIGSKMVEAGVIDNKEEIFYLDLNDLEQFSLHEKLSPLQDKINKVKVKFEKYEQQEMPDRIIFQGEEVPILNYDQQAIGEENQLQGIAVSKGKVKAPALVLHQPKVDRKIHHEILVTHVTDPGWIFLMSQAAGLISEKGSLLSHTAIVGRELGIPTIVGVTNATKLIKSGDPLEIDGSKGIINLLHD